MLASLGRQLFVLIPAAWLLAKLTNNVNMVWWSFLIAEIVSGILTLVFFKKVYKEVVEPL